MKKILLTLSSLVMLSGQNTLCSAPKSQVQSSSVRIAALGHVACHVLSVSLVAYPVFKFSLKHLSPMTGNHAFLQGTAQVSALMLGALASDGVNSLWPFFYKVCGCSDEFISDLCDESSEIIENFYQWAFLGGLAYTVANVFQ